VSRGKRASVPLAEASKELQSERASEKETKENNETEGSASLLARRDCGDPLFIWP
jgi:hypothetical protein